MKASRSGHIVDATPASRRPNGTTVLAVTLRPSRPAPRFFIGIDGGGSGTRARLQDGQGRLLGWGQAGPSQLSQPADSAWAAVQLAIVQAFDQAGLPPAAPCDCAVGLGLAGAGVAASAQAFIGDAPAYAALALDSDATAALLGAFDGQPGVLLAAGTGSVGIAQSADGRRRLAGGWGFGIGDEGGGAWLGQRAVQLAQQALDGRCAGGTLAQAVWRVAGADRATLVNWCRQAGQAEHAQLAPLVFHSAQADPAAARLLALAAGELAALAEALDPGGTLPVVVSGSVGQRLQPRLPAALLARCIGPIGDATQGALRLLHSNIHGQTAARSIPSERLA